ncbi:hypothetical protein STRAU_2882 [Streptomyces aurantiacus JA 4570]|uniref:Uncharacterized protein n=1 Tax=Streptomyces aurantiacus JA 4570 TaxID=1286094 RepID=S3ZKR6_9ACTN|nr:hypothetical protein STRAU_2882 [Streptomyces aurantiacus JA 4570]
MSVLPGLVAHGAERPGPRGAERLGADERHPTLCRCRWGRPTERQRFRHGKDLPPRQVFPSARRDLPSTQGDLPPTRDPSRAPSLVRTGDTRSAFSPRANSPARPSGRGGPAKSQREDQQPWP